MAHTRFTCINMSLYGHNVLVWPEITARIGWARGEYCYNGAAAHVRAWTGSTKVLGTWKGRDPLRCWGHGSGGFDKGVGDMEGAGSTKVLGTWKGRVPL